MSYETTSNIENESPLHFGTFEWYHQCTALNTVTGHIIVVVNGKVHKDEVDARMVDSSSSRPISLKGKNKKLATNFFFYS